MATNRTTMLSFVNVIWAPNTFMFIVKMKTGEETKTKQKQYKRHTETPSQCSV